MSIRSVSLSTIRRLAFTPAFILTLLLLCSASLNYLLARKVKSLKETVSVLRAEGRLAVGTTLPPLTVKGLDGRPATISYLGNDRPTVLYVFKPECGWCTRNLPNLKALARSVSGEYRLVLLSLTDGALRDYVARNELEDIPVYGGLAEAERITYKLGGTPQTIVVSKEGKVLKSWMGAYTGASADEIEEHFNTRLPGLAEQVAAERAGGN